MDTIIYSRFQKKKKTNLTSYEENLCIKIVFRNENDRTLIQRQNLRNSHSETKHVLSEDFKYGTESAHKERINPGERRASHGPDGRRGAPRRTVTQHLFTTRLTLIKTSFGGKHPRRKSQLGLPGPGPGDGWENDSGKGPPPFK